MTTIDADDDRRLFTVLDARRVRVVGRALTTNDDDSFSFDRQTWTLTDQSSVPFDEL